MILILSKHYKKKETMYGKIALLAVIILITVFISIVLRIAHGYRGDVLPDQKNKLRRLLVVITYTQSVFAIGGCMVAFCGLGETALLIALAFSVMGVCVQAHTLVQNLASLIPLLFSMAYVKFGGECTITDWLVTPLVLGLFAPLLHYILPRVSILTKIEKVAEDWAEEELIETSNELDSFLRKLRLLK